jgi:hypothetical protein
MANECSKERQFLFRRIPYLDLAADSGVKQCERGGGGCNAHSRYRCVGQLPSTCGIARFRPPWRLGSSCTLTRVLDAYRSWNAAGKGGSDGPGFGSWRGFLHGGESLRCDSGSGSTSDSESEY